MNLFNLFKKANNDLNKALDLWKSLSQYPIMSVEYQKRLEELFLLCQTAIASDSRDGDAHVLLANAYYLVHTLKKIDASRSLPLRFSAAVIQHWITSGFDRYPWTKNRDNGLKVYDMVSRDIGQTDFKKPKDATMSAIERESYNDAITQPVVLDDAKADASSIEDWVPADLPDWTRNMFEEIYVSLVLAVSRVEIMGRMTGNPVNMPIKFAQELFQGIEQRNKYDSTMAAIMASRLGKELGIPNSTDYLELLWAVVYHYGRGMSLRIIKQQAMEGHLAFGNTEFLESDIKNRLLERAVEELPKMLRR